MGVERHPAAELARLRDYERFKRAAEEIERLLRAPRGVVLLRSLRFVEPPARPAVRPAPQERTETQLTLPLPQDNLL